MNKYYVTWGDNKIVLSAASEAQACLIALRKLSKHLIKTKDDEDAEQRFADDGGELTEYERLYEQKYQKKKPYAVMGASFRVSQLGFDEHDDDVIYTTDEIVRLRILANNPGDDNPLPPMEDGDDENEDFADLDA